MIKNHRDKAFSAVIDADIAYPVRESRKGESRDGESTRMHITLPGNDRVAPDTAIELKEGGTREEDSRKKTGKSGNQKKK